MTKSSKKPKKAAKSQKNKQGKNGKQPQKRSTLGAEVEFFVLNKDGHITNQADQILNKLKRQKKKLDIVKEVGKNMLEVGCYPDLDGINSLESLLENLETLISEAEKENLIICPLGTYPGENNPEIRPYRHYKTEEKLIGRNLYKAAARCCGLHIHYALPWGVFDYKKQDLKKLINSKHKQSMVNSYNFLLAADPALTTFAQSSPFYQGEFIGKDARALTWRGDRDLNFTPSLYNNFPQYGELQWYQHTGTDLIDFTKRIHKDWLNLLKENGAAKKEISPYNKTLYTNWTPLRISYHGTMEQRGMDVNTPLIILAVSQVIKNILTAIQEEFVQIEASDIAIEEPFKYERKKILIPPFTYVKRDLQRRAFYKGMEDKTIYRYCKRLLWLARKFGHKKDDEILEPLDKMLEKRRTVSDEITNLAKKLGHKNLKKTMPNEIAAEIALTYSARLYKEMVLFRELVKRLG